MMDPTVALVWHAFLESVHPHVRNDLLKSLTPAMSAQLNNAPLPKLPVSQGTGLPEDQIDHIHGSWFTPFLRTLAENDIHAFLSCLTPLQIETLQKALLSTAPLLRLSPLGSTYLRQTLFYKIADTTLPPVSCLPEDPLNALLELSPAEFNSLIELLSMHDLSLEIRQIIETKKLKEIHSVLTKSQEAFLKTLLHKRESVSFKKMGLSHWAGDQEALRSLLLQRGLNRIAKALFEKSPHLLWYLSHRLDAEKGKSLLSLCTAVDHPQAAQILATEVLELVHAIKNHKGAP